MTGKELFEAYQACPDFVAKAELVKKNYNEMHSNPNKFHRTLKAWQQECFRHMLDYAKHREDRKFEIPGTDDFLKLRMTKEDK